MSTFKPGDVVKVLVGFRRVAVVCDGDDARGYLIFVSMGNFGTFLTERFPLKVLARVTK